MGDTIAVLIEELGRRMGQVDAGRITNLVREAREEAFREVTAVLKDRMVAVILEQALQQMDEMTKDAALPVPSATGMAEPPADDAEFIRQEIEALRARIAGNEQEIHSIQTTGAPPQTGGAEIAPEPLEIGTGICLYAVVDANEQVPPLLPAAGLDSGYPVYAIPFRAQWAIVSQVSLSEFGQKRLDENLKDIQWLETKAFAHQAVLDCLVGGYTFVPMRLCTIYRNEDSLLEVLTEYHGVFDSSLSRLRGTQEWGVKAHCNQDAMVGWVQESNPAIRERMAELDKKSGGTVYFLKKKLDDQIADEVMAISDETAQNGHDRLRQLAAGSVVNSPRNGDNAEKGDRMILNAAYLVSCEGLAPFQAEVERLRREYAGLGCSFEVTGPWPPYNFAVVELEGCQP